LTSGRRKRPDHDGLGRSHDHGREAQALAGTRLGAMPAKLSLSPRAIVAAGLATLVDEVKK
jgi:hypothetical protein